MKFLYALTLFLFCGDILHAQVGIGTTTPNPNAVLELVSPGSDQGLLTPRLTTAQRTALTFSTSENGLLVYDSDENRFYYWSTSQWLPIREGNDVALTAGPGIEISENKISVIADGDGDALNEIQDLALNGSTLSITNNGAATPVDLAPFLGFNTDEQDLAYDAATGVLSITNGTSATVTPAGAAGGVLSGTYPDPGLADNAVINTKIANGAISTTKIADAAVTTGKIAPSATDGQVLITSGGVTAWSTPSAAGIGTVSSITAGTGLSGGTINTSGTIALSNTLASGGTYGSSTQIPTFTVNQQGRLTAVGSVSVSGTSPEGLAETLKASPDAQLGAAYNLSSVSIGDWSKVAGPGALNVNGSHYVSFTEVSGSYTVVASDYILVNVAGKPATIDLPLASENRGRILIIRSAGSSTLDGILVNAKDLIDGFTQFEPLFMDPVFGNNTAYSITVLSTGTTWITIDRAIAGTKLKG